MVPKHHDHDNDNDKCRDNTDGADVPRDKIKRHLKKAAMEQRKTEVKEKR